MGNRAQAVQLYNTAITAVNDLNNPKRYDHAYAMFASACFADPTWWEPWFQMGNNCSNMEKKEAAVAYYFRALTCDMKDDDRGKVATNLGWKLHQLGKTEEALHWSLLATKLAPELPFAYVNLSCIYQIKNESAISLVHAQKALERAPDDPTIQTQHAFALLFDGRWASGLKAFECRFAYELKNFLHFPFPKWQGEEGKTVYLVSDQGLGDTLCYSRFIPEVCKRSKYVHAFIHAELLRAFTYAFSDIPNLNLMPNAMPYPPCDHWSTFVSLPYALGLTNDEIVNAPPPNLPRYFTPVNWKVPNRKLHVGIAWAGSSLNKIDNERNIPVKMFNKLASVPGLQMYSLQVGVRAGELHEQGMSALVYDLVPYIRDIVDTVSILQHLDMVVGVESAITHICSAVGKEYWCAYSRMGKDYRMGTHGVRRLWHPNMRVFNQGDDMNWEPVFEEVRDALIERVRLDAEPEGRIVAQAVA